MSDTIKRPKIKAVDKIARSGDGISAVVFVGVNYCFTIDTLGFLSKAKGRGFEYKRLDTLKKFKQTAKLPSRRLIRTRIKKVERLLK